MECKHVEDTVCDIRELINSNNWICSACGTPNSPWMCLVCGTVHCGRYECGHAQTHYKETQLAHCLCMDCHNWSVYCYKCDEFAVNDTVSGLIGDIRQRFFDVQKPRPRPITGVKRKRQESNSSTDSAATKKAHGKCTKSAGLQNLGNTCFMNSVLQALCHIEPFCSFMRQLPSLEQPINKRIQTRSISNPNCVYLVEELRQLLVAMWAGGRAIEAYEFHAAVCQAVPRFRGYQQQDSHEFLRCVQERLHSDLCSLLGDERMESIVTQLFGGQLLSQVTCLTCHTCSKKVDAFLDLSLDIPVEGGLSSTTQNHSSNVCTNENERGDTVHLNGHCDREKIESAAQNKENCDIITINEPDALVAGSSLLNGTGCQVDQPVTSNCGSTAQAVGEKRLVTLKDCLSHFTALEHLNNAERYQCTNCKMLMDSTKRLTIQRAPQVLCLQLKRFRWSGLQRHKINTSVDFPLTDLDLSPYAADENAAAGREMYDLAAVVYHQGPSTAGGHYKACVLRDGRWYHCDDSRVIPCYTEDVRTVQAYLLCYVRQQSSGINT